MRTIVLQRRVFKYKHPSGEHLDLHDCVQFPPHLVFPLNTPPRIYQQFSLFQVPRFQIMGMGPVHSTGLTCWTKEPCLLHILLSLPIKLRKLEGSLRNHSYPKNVLERAETGISDQICMN